MSYPASLCSTPNPLFVRFQDRPHGIVIRTAIKSFNVYAASHAEKDAWLGVLQTYGSQGQSDPSRHRSLRPLGPNARLAADAALLRDDTGVRRGAEEEMAAPMVAVWVPDSKAGVCMVCRVSSFNVLNRRVRKNNNERIPACMVSSQSLFFSLTRARTRHCLVADDSTTAGGAGALSAATAPPGANGLGISRSLCACVTRVPRAWTHSCRCICTLRCKLFLYAIYTEYVTWTRDGRGRVFVQKRRRPRVFSNGPLQSLACDLGGATRMRPSWATDTTRRPSWV